MRKYYVGNREWNNLVSDFENHNMPVEYIDSREGCLQDYFFCYAGNLLIAGFEHYENPWSSSIELWVARTDNDKKKLWKKWNEFINTYDLEVQEG